MGGKSRAGSVAILAALAVALFIPGTSAAGDVRQEVSERLLARINQDRVRHGLRPVTIDPEASAAASRYCGNQVEAGTRGHFSVDGLPPYMRYSFAGIDGHVLENTAAWTARETIPVALVPKMAERSHNEMIAEIPPDDGHRRAILDPYVTHVGIGVAWGGGDVRVAEVFLRRHLTWVSKDQTVRPGEERTYRARLLDRGMRVDRVTVHYEPFPYRLTRERANRIETYALPPELIRLEPEREPSALDAAIRPEAIDGRGSFGLSDGVLSLDLRFTAGRGIYTIVVWARPHRSAGPVAVSNLSVVADGAPAGIAVGSTR